MKTGDAKVSSSPEDTNNGDVLTKTGQDDAKRADHYDTGSKEAQKHPGKRFHVMWLVLALFTASMVILLSTYSQYLVARFTQEVQQEWNVSETLRPVNTSGLGVRVMLEAQARVATLKIYLSLVSGIPSVVTVFALGAFSDRIGRKILFFIPMCGFGAMTATYAVISHWSLPIYYAYIGHFLEGASGGFIAMLVGVFAYTSDLTKGGNSRSLRITLVEAVLVLTFGVTEVALGQMIHYWGYTIPFMVATSLLCLDVIVTKWLLPESRSRPAENPDFGLKRYVYSTFYFYFSKKANNHRIAFQICACTFFILALVGLGKPSVDILFMLNTPLRWDSLKIGYFGMAHRGCVSLGSVVLVGGLQRWLSDAKLGILATISFLLGAIIQGLAWDDTLMFTSVAVGCFSGAAIPLLRAILSKLTPQGKHGAMFGSLAIVEATTLLTNGVIFNMIYRATLVVFHGAVYMVMAGLLLIPIALFLVLERILHKSADNKTIMVLSVKVSPHSETLGHT